MRSNFSKLALVAGILLALAFTFGCSSGGDGGGDSTKLSSSSDSWQRKSSSSAVNSSSSVPNSSGSEQSYNYCIIAGNTCLTGPFTASTCTGQLSNNCPNGSSPSINSSSSSVVVSSSSVQSSSSKGSSSSSGGGGSFNVNSQIYNEDGTLYTGNGIIEISSYMDCWGSSEGSGCEWDHIKVGSVANGIVNLELPLTIPNEYLIKFQRYCTDYSQDLKIYFAELILTNSNGNYIGELVIRDKQIQIEELITYTYFSKSEKINCNSNDDDFNRLGFNYNFNIDVKEGWNKMYSKANYVNGKIATVEYSTNNILTKEKEMKWILEKNGGGGGGGN